LKPQALAERASHDVANHDLDRNDLDLADELLAHIEAADEVSRHADLVQPAENILRNPVVEDALAFEALVLLGVECGRVVLEMLNKRAWFRPFIENLRLSLVDAAAAVIHGKPP